MGLTITLAKRWKRANDRAVWWLVATGVACVNRAAITGPTSRGEYQLELWNDRAGWEVYMAATDLKTLKVIGRMEAARRLNV